MISAISFLIAAQGGFMALPQRKLPDTAKDWLFIGKDARVVHFEVKSEDPSDKNIVKLNSLTGYIVLAEHRFTVSVAGWFGTGFASYENGVLKRNRESVIWSTPYSEEKKTGIKMGLLEALCASLDESIHSGFGDLIRDLFVRDMVSSRLSGPGIEPLVEGKPGAYRTCEFDGSWRSLKRVEWLSGSGRTICDFKVVLPKVR